MKKVIEEKDPHKYYVVEIKKNASSSSWIMANKSVPPLIAFGIEYKSFVRVLHCGNKLGALWSSSLCAPSELIYKEEKTWDQVHSMLEGFTTTSLFLACFTEFIQLNLCKGVFQFKDYIFIKSDGPKHCFVIYKDGPTSTKRTYNKMSDEYCMPDLKSCNVVHFSEEELLTHPLKDVRRHLLDPNRIGYENTVSVQMDLINDLRGLLAQVMVKMEKIEKGPTKRVYGYKVEFPKYIKMLGDWKKTEKMIQALINSINKKTPDYRKQLLSVKGPKSIAWTLEKWTPDDKRLEL